ncbi:hypothetical protein ACNKHS_00845 [Shigella flexneri]
MRGKKNISLRRIPEIEGLPDLKVEQAFELTDASAERFCRWLYYQAEQRTDHPRPWAQHRPAEVDDCGRLWRLSYLERRIQGMDSLANPEAAGSRCSMLNTRQ